MAVGTQNHLTIEQLAGESGMTVRNIRAHQARGLLDPPEVRQRVGYYGPDHVAQLRLIRELQEEGFNLGGIKRLLDDTDGTAGRLLAFKDALRATTHAERAETLSVAELGRRFRVSAADAPAVLARAERLGVLVRAGEGIYEVPSPSLLALAEEAIGRGVSLSSALELLAEIERHCDSISASFIRLFLHEVWEPFQEADMPTERWPEIEKAAQRLKPIASEALGAAFEQRLSAQIQLVFREMIREADR